MSPKTSSSHSGNSPVASASRAAHSPLTMSSSVTNSPAGLLGSSLVQSSPHSNSSPQSGDESLHSLNSLNAQHPPLGETNHHLVNLNSNLNGNLNNSSGLAANQSLNNSPLLNSSSSLNSNSTSPSEQQHGLSQQSAGGQLHLNNRSPIANSKTSGSPLTNGGSLANSGGPLMKPEPAELKADTKLHQFNETMYNPANGPNGNPTLNGLIASNSQLLSNSTPSVASSSHPTNHSPSSIKMKPIESNDTSLNSSINSTISPSNSAQQPPLTTSVPQQVPNVQWTGNCCVCIQCLHSKRSKFCRVRRHFRFRRTITSSVAPSSSEYFSNLITSSNESFGAESLIKRSDPRHCACDHNSDPVAEHFKVSAVSSAVSCNSRA